MLINQCCTVSSRHHLIGFITVVWQSCWWFYMKVIYITFCHLIQPAELSRLLILPMIFNFVHDFWGWNNFFISHCSMELVFKISQCPCQPVTVMWWLECGNSFMANHSGVTEFFSASSVSQWLASLSWHICPVTGTVKLRLVYKLKKCCLINTARWAAQTFYGTAPIGVKLMKIMFCHDVSCGHAGVNSQPDLIWIFGIPLHGSISQLSVCTLVNSTIDHSCQLHASEASSWDCKPYYQSDCNFLGPLHCYWVKCVYFIDATSLGQL